MDDKLIKNFLKFLNITFWILLIIIFIFWYSENKDEFFPSREIEQIRNPINPFK